MTAQFVEALYFRDECLPMSTLPLEHYFLFYQDRPDLHGNTALERGYVGTWAIEDNRLRLLVLQGEYRSDRQKQLCLSDIFPGQERVFAFWYSGVLRCPRGKRLQYIHMGFQSVYEQDLYLIIEKGVLIAEHLVSNPHPPPVEVNQFAIPAFLRNREGYDWDD